LQLKTVFRELVRYLVEIGFRRLEKETNENSTVLTEFVGFRAEKAFRRRKNVRKFIGFSGRSLSLTTTKMKEN